MPDHYVLHIAKWYPNEDDDLEGIFIKRQIEATQTHYNTIVFYARSSGKTISGRLYETCLEQSGNNYTYIGYYKQKITGFPLLDKMIKTGLYFLIMSRFYNVVKKNISKPIILHAHVMLRTALMSLWLSWKLKIPYIISEHSTFYTSNLKISKWNFKNWCRRIVVKKAHAIITVSEDLERGMKNFGLNNKNYTRIFNCVDTTLYNYQSKIDTGKIQLLHVSEFKDEHKNILRMLQVIDRLSKNQIPFLFHLVGYGKDLNKILMLIKSNKLESQIVYHGKLLDNQLSGLYQSADAFILFSNKENMPCVIAESLCCGTPVISTRVGGVSEIIHEGNGILLEKENQEQLYNAILSLIQGKINFDNKKVSEEALQLFSFESVGDRMIQVYESCLNKIE